jgi:collagenase-like PrtC family protease
VQTLSYNYCNLIGSLDRLAGAGVTSLRLSPHSGDFVAIAKNFAGVLAGDIEPGQALASMQASAPEAEFSDGFLFRDCGAAPLAS